MNSPEGPEVGGDAAMAELAAESQRLGFSYGSGLSEERLVELEHDAKKRCAMYSPGFLNHKWASDELALIAEVRRLRAGREIEQEALRNALPRMVDLHEENERLHNYIQANQEERDEIKGCPHVVTGDEGTAYCDLAESSVRALRERVKAFEAVEPWAGYEEFQCVGCGYEDLAKPGHRPDCPWGGDGQ